MMKPSTIAIVGVGVAALAFLALRRPAASQVAPQPLALNPVNRAGLLAFDVDAYARKKVYG